MIIFMIVIVIIMIMVLFLYVIVMMMMMIITCDAWTAFWDTWEVNAFFKIIIAIRTPSWETHLTSLDLSPR